MLRRINQQDIKDHWKELVPHIEKILTSNDHLWYSEDVYCAIMSGSSWLYIGYNEANEKTGFVVLTPMLDCKDQILHIWLGVGFENNDSFVFASDDVKELAKLIGAKRITFSTTRPGMGKLVEKAGYKPAGQLFFAEV